MSDSPTPQNAQSVRELAVAVGRSPSWVRKAITEGMPSLADGTFDVEKVREWMKARPDGRRALGKSATYPQDRRGRTDRRPRALGDPDGELDNVERYRKLKADDLELKVKAATRELIPRAEVRNLLVSRATEFQRSLLLMPRRMAPALVGLEAREIQAKLEAEARRILDIYARAGDDPLLQEVDHAATGTLAGGAPSAQAAGEAHSL